MTQTVGEIHGDQNLAHVFLTYDYAVSRLDRHSEQGTAFAEFRIGQNLLNANFHLDLSRGRPRTNTQNSETLLGLW
jgi:hypothetical protein